MMTFLQFLMIVVDQVAVQKLKQQAMGLIILLVVP